MSVLLALVVCEVRPEVNELRLKRVLIREPLI